MPIHDWTEVDAITDVLNQRLLSAGRHALAEQHGVRFEPDVLALKAIETPEPDDASSSPVVDVAGESGVGLMVAESDLDYYRRRQNVAAIRHVSGEGNKSGRKAFDDFVRKAAEFLAHGIHLLILDVQPPISRDPQGIHGATWDEVAGDEYARPVDKPRTLAAYESSSRMRAFVEPVAVGDVPIDMPLFLAPGRHVALPIDETYRIAFDSFPTRWRTVLAPA
jgi:hypothetical protein